MPTIARDDIDPLIPIIRSQMIPCWERFGTDRLAVTAQTRTEFEAQSSLALIDTSVKKRIGKRVTSRNRRTFNNTSSFIESWPEDDQATFRYPTLVFTVEGQADFPVADYVIHCPPQHFLLFAAGVPRPIGSRPHFVGDTPKQRQCSVLWFFDPPGTSSVTAYVCHSTANKHWNDGYCMVHRSEVIHLYKLLLREIEGQGKFIDLSFRIFLHFFLRELQEGRFHREGKISAPNAQENSASPIEQAQQYIKTHLNSSLTAANVAGQVYMSRNNFLRHFPRETGQSFHQYVIEQRMEEAGRLLRDGQWSIQYICRFTGLKPTQFRAQFKKYFGMNPSEFRRQPHKRC